MSTQRLYLLATILCVMNLALLLPDLWPSFDHLAITGAIGWLVAAFQSSLLWSKSRRGRIP